MKKLTLLPLLAIALFSWKTIPADTWTLDEHHARLRFSISHLSLADVEGSFKIKESSVTSNGKDFADATVTLVADAASVDTDNEMRDKSLRTADFLDTDKYPTITFKSTSFKKTGDHYTVTGPLTLHGVTKNVTLTAVAKLGENPMNHVPMSGFKVTGTINRKDFGISTSTPSAMLGEEIQIVANVEYIKK
jgi:polyisoprenoid-binding protein YceI